MPCMRVIWSLFIVCVTFASGQELLNVTYCYGDNSGGSNLVNVVCSPNVVHVVAIITGSKNLNLNCPSEQHAFSETEQEVCCMYDDTDCAGLYNGDTSAYTACNGKVTCQGLPVVRTFTDASCISDDFPLYTNYMMFQYHCIEPYNLHGACNTSKQYYDECAYNLHGACNTSAQCYDDWAVCENDVCVCGPGTTEQNNRCYKDGTPGGKCNAAISCLGQNVTCIMSVCTCDAGFSGVRDECVKDGTLGGQCSATIPCTDDKTVCSPEGLCECVSGYEVRDSACFKEDYYLINGSYCYGDSSNGNNLINVTCDTGVVYVYDVIAGSKPISKGCPEEDHFYSPAEHDECCAYNGDDCLTPYTGDWTNFLACDGLRTCYGVPIIRIETDPLCNATMGGNTYKRFSNYMIFQYYCVPDYRLHGACNTTDQCTDANAVCNNNVCLCGPGTTEIDDTCPLDGSVGGFCSDTIPCTDDNTECTVDGVCQCVTSFSLIGDTCIEDGAPGGNCIGGVGGTCTDGNAQCSTDGLCECVADHSEINGTCITDGSVGGRCNTDSTCDGDHTVCDTSPSLDCGRLSCDPGVCVCIDGYSPNTGGLCLLDGSLGGRCSDLIACEDPDTVCSADGVCECRTDYTDIYGTCVRDGVVGGYCNASFPCEDGNATCGTDNVCQCDAGYSDRNYVCIPDGTVGGTCLSGSLCSQANTECASNGTCVCVQPYAEVNRVCRTDGDLLGKCDIDGNCDDPYAVCDTNSGLLCGVYTCQPGVCLCVDGYSPSTDGVCVEDGVIGGKCSASAPVIPCQDSNAVCSVSGLCECQSGYTEYKAVCVADGEIGGSCSLDADCSNANSVCSNDGGVNLCTCDVGFSEVDRACKQDGGLDGLCDAADSSCTGAFTTCNTSTSAQCGFSTCNPGICTCQTGYSVVDNSGDCVKDGDLGGRCDSDGDCNDASAVCDTLTSICVCPSGFTDIAGACMEDGEIGGSCSVDANCSDANSVCSNDGGINLCTCDVGYSEVDRACKQDGDLGGLCDATDSSCTGAFTTCNTSTSAQCGFSTCNPGICTCQTGYSIVDNSGDCVKDGDLGGRCDSDSDCNDANAVCDTLTSICVCPSGFTDIAGACMEDGAPDGVCLSPDSMCLDPHSVCVDGVCRCNTARHYSNQAGTCIRDDGYIHGTCGSSSQCVGDNVRCSLDGVCECLPGYDEVNGECMQDETPAVTSCEGDSPYNALQPDCPAGSDALILREVGVVKPASSGCPGVMDTYSEVVYQACCTPGEGDCEVVTDIATDCDPAITWLPDINYSKLEYVCTLGDDTVAVDDDGDVTGRPVILTSPNYPDADSSSQSEHLCSVQATCQSVIDVFFLLNDLVEDSGGCLQKLDITEGSTTTSFDCSSAAGGASIYTSSGTYFIIKLVNTDPSIRGKFVVKFEAQISTSDVIVSCGNTLVSTPAEVGVCDPIPGAVGGACSTTFPCSDPNTVCVNDVCSCRGGYTLADGGCAGGGGGEGPSFPIGAIIGGVIGALLLAAGLILFLLRRRIRNKFCPKEKQPLDEVMPITHPVVGAAPVNTKFPKRPDLFAGNKPGNLPPLPGRQPKQPSIVDYLNKEQEEDIKMRNSLNGGFPLPRIGADSVSKPKFSRSASSAHMPATAPTSNGFSQSVFARPPPGALPSIQKPERKDSTRKSKKKSKAFKTMQKAKVGISASRAFEVPIRGREGTYRPLPDMGHHPPPAPPGAGNALPPWRPNTSDSPHPPPDLRNAPVHPYNPANPLSGSIGDRIPNSVPRNPASASGFAHSNFPSMPQNASLHPPPDVRNAPVQSYNPANNPLSGSIGDRIPNSVPRSQPAAGFNPSSQWRKAGMAASFTNPPPFQKRHSILEISTVNEPDSVETTELD